MTNYVRSYLGRWMTVIVRHWFSSIVNHLLMITRLRFCLTISSRSSKLDWLRSRGRRIRLWSLLLSWLSWKISWRIWTIRFSMRRKVRFSWSNLIRRRLRLRSIGRRRKPGSWRTSWRSRKRFLVRRKLLRIRILLNLKIKYKILSISTFTQVYY